MNKKEEKVIHFAIREDWLQELKFLFEGRFTTHKSLVKHLLWESLESKRSK